MYLRIHVYNFFPESHNIVVNIHSPKQSHKGRNYLMYEYITLAKVSFIIHATDNIGTYVEYNILILMDCTITGQKGGRLLQEDTRDFRPLVVNHPSINIRELLHKRQGARSGSVRKSKGETNSRSTVSLRAAC